MTKQRIDLHSTEFGIWLRQQPEIDSRIKGFIATNVDYMWRNFRTGEWMFIEEKRYGAEVKFPQNEMFEIINNACKNDKYYRGLHVIIFENTSPDDGKIWLDGRNITAKELISFLRFGK